MKIFPNKQKFKGEKQDSMIGHPDSREAEEQDSQHTQETQENVLLSEQRGKRPREEPLSTYIHQRGRHRQDYNCWWPNCSATFSRNSNKTQIMAIAVTMTPVSTT